MPAVRGQGGDQLIELRIERRQVALLGVAALVLFGAVFALGVLVGRQIASTTFASPQQPPPGDLAALDAASRAPKAPKVVAPPAEAEEPKAASPKQAEPAAPSKAVEKAEPEEKGTSTAPGNEPADDDEPAPKAIPAKAAPAAEKGPARPEPKPEPKRAETGRFTVQLGASPDKKVAEKIQAKARAAGFDVRVVEVDLGAKGTWYRVRAGSFASKDEAARVQKDAERQLRVAAMVVPAQ